MNVRDPFNLHWSPAFNILRGTATQAANVTLRVREAGAQAYDSGKQVVEDMSFSIPQNIPSFTAPQRELENRVWGASGVTARSATHSNGGVINEMQSRVGGFFDHGRGDLPMYKDKPYSYTSSRRQRSMWRRKRSIGIGALLIFIVLYYFSFFSSDLEGAEKPKENWSWLQSSEKGVPMVNWLERREKVKEAFTLSWDAYERYAWGMSQKLQILSTFQKYSDKFL